MTYRHGSADLDSGDDGHISHFGSPISSAPGSARQGSYKDPGSARSFGTPRDGRRSTQATPRTPGRSPRTPRSQKSSQARRTNSAMPAWDDDQPVETPVQEDMDDAQIKRFWSMHWEAAGYVKDEYGDYHKASAGEESLFDHPTAAELHEEERRQQVLLRGVDPDDEKRANATIDVEGSGWNALADYARVGDVDKARELLQLSERVGNMANVINKTDRFGWTAMHWACESSLETTSLIQRERKLAIVKTLCKEYRNHLDLNIRSGRGNTSLVHAVWSDNSKAVQLLLKKKGVDLNLTTEYGWTALHWAAQGKKDSDGHWHPLRDVLQVLLKRTYEANVNAASQGGDTPLHLACMRGFKSCVDILILAGADVKKKNSNGQTALHTSVCNENYKLIQPLLAVGASGSDPDRQGRTPASILCAQIVSLVKARLFPKYASSDFVERKEIDSRFVKWVRDRELPPRLLTASIEARDVLIFSLPACQQSVMAPPYELDLDAIEEVQRHLAVLRMLAPSAVPAQYPSHSDASQWEDL